MWGWCLCKLERRKGQRSCPVSKIQRLRCEKGLAWVMESQTELSKQNTRAEPGVVPGCVMKCQSLV